MKPRTRSEQDKKRSLWIEPGTRRTTPTCEHPGGRPQDQGRQKPQRRSGPSLPKTVRHPTDTAEMRKIPGKRSKHPSSPNPSRGNPIDNSRIGHDGPSCFQDPPGAIRHRHQPPKQNENPIRHPLSLANQLVLAVNSRTRRILAIRYAPAFPADCQKHLNSMFVFLSGKNSHESSFYPMRRKLQRETDSSSKAKIANELARCHCQ